MVFGLLDKDVGKQCWRQMKIKSATVIKNKQGNDRIYLEIEAPSPNPGKLDNHWLTTSFEASRGHGQDYVKKNFHIEPNIIDLNSLGEIPKEIKAKA